MNNIIKNSIIHSNINPTLIQNHKAHQIDYLSKIIKSISIKKNENKSLLDSTNKKERKQKGSIIKNHLDVNMNNIEKKFISNRLLMGINSESESNLKKVSYRKFGNMAITNIKKSAIINNNISNKTNNFFKSNKKSEKTIPTIMNYTVKLIFKSNKPAKRNKYRKINPEKNLNDNLSKTNLSFNKNIKSLITASKKVLKDQKISKNVNKDLAISINQKNQENSLIKEKTKTNFNYIFSKTNYKKRPISTEINEIIKKRKKISENNVIRNLNKFDLNKIKSKIKKIKKDENFFNNKSHISLNKYKNKKMLLENTISNIDSKKKESTLSMKFENYPKFQTSYSFRNQLLTFNTEFNNTFNPHMKSSNIPGFKKVKRINTFKGENQGINSLLNIKKEEDNDNNFVYKKIINKGKSKLIIKNKSNIINCNLDTDKRKKTKIIMKKIDNLKLKGFDQSQEEEGEFPKKKDNLLLSHKELYSSEKNKNKFKKILKEKKINHINLTDKIKNINKLNYNERIINLNDIFKCDNFIQMIFSFCENDIDLLNKISTISKKIFRKIKPLIYKRIYSLIKKYHENINTRNKIKKYFMQNNSSLFKLSPPALYIKYNDLLLENSKYDNEIKKDLTRTFPNNILFKHGNIYYNKLYHVLTAYSNFNKNIGYAQGINFLAAHMIYIFENEIDELIFLDALINKFQLDKIMNYEINKEFFEKIFQKINLFLIEKMPKLNEFLNENNLNIEFFTTNWILTLFGNSMDNEFFIIVLDYMCIFGWKFVKYFILNILLLYENDIIYSTQNDLFNIKKNMMRNEKFKNHFAEILKDIQQMMINDENII